MRSILGLVEMLVSVGFASLTAFLAGRLFMGLTRGLDEVRELREGNTAVGVTLGAVLVSCGLVVQSAVRPLLETLDLTLHDDAGAKALVRWALGASLVVVVAVLASIFAMLLALRLFRLLTGGVDALEGVAAGRLSVAVPLAALVVVVGLFVARGVEGLYENLLPYPQARTLLLDEGGR